MKTLSRRCGVLIAAVVLATAPVRAAELFDVPLRNPAFTEGADRSGVPSGWSPYGGGKNLEDGKKPALFEHNGNKIAFIGCGASNVAISRLIFGWGATPANCTMVDTKGILGKHRKDLEMRKAEYKDKWKLCNITNAEGREGDIPDAMRGADVCIALSRSGPGVLQPEWIKTMAKDAIVFACANPVPEIWPWEALEAGAAVVATGRSDFPNQVNNSLGFPGIFRGALDVRARTITDEMCYAAAKAMADHVGDALAPDHIMPTMDDWEVFPREAAAVAMKAQEQGLARLETTFEKELENAKRIIKRSRDLTGMMMREGFIPEAPVDENEYPMDAAALEAAY